MNLPKGLFLVGFADAVGSGVAAIFWFYLASLLLPEEYGEIFYFLGIAGIASYFALFGTQNTIIVYVAKNIKLQSTFYVISLGVGAIGMFIAFIIFNRIDVGLLIFGYIINTLATGELLGRKSYESYVKYILIQKGLTFVLGIGFYNLFGIEGIIYALTLTYIAFTIIIYKGFKNSKVDFVLLKNKIGFVTNNYFMNITGAFNGQIDKLVIGPLLGFSILGNYSLALQVVLVLFVIPGIVYKYTLTHDASGEQNKQIKKFTVLISIGLAIVVMVSAPSIIPLFFPKYEDSIQAVQIMSLDVIPSTIGYFYISRLLGIEKSKFVVISYILGLATITSGMIILGQAYGIIGLAVSFVLSSTIQLLFLFFTKNKAEKKINY